MPAWYGHAGHMEFPAWRVIARKAAIAHELAHVFFPNGNRFLAEGLAVHLQAEIGGNPAFPNFGMPLHELALKNLRNMAPGDPRCLDLINLADLDALATPGPLELRVGAELYGEEPRGQSHLYSLAGSFARFLIEMHGMDRFRALYALSPLVPLQQNAGTPGRWMDVYGVSLATLQDGWTSLLGSTAES